MVVLARNLLCAAVLVSASAALAQSARPLEARATPLDTFCARLSSTCAKACLARTGSSNDVVSTCEKGTENFDFGCVCSDKVSIITDALTSVTGFIAQKSVTKVVTRGSTTTVADVETVVLTPLATESDRVTKTKYTKTKSTTVTAIQPSFFPGGDLKERRAASSSTFCSAYTSSCKAQCSSAKSSAKVNTCSRASTSDTLDSYALVCTCANKQSLTQAALGDVGKKGVKATSTATSTLRTTSTKVLSSFASTTTSTGPGSIKTVQVPVTKTTAKLAVHTVAIDRPGRIRVDRLDRGIPHDTVGYLSTQSLNVSNFPYIQVDPNAATAANVTLQVDAANATNVYGVRWNRGKGKVPYYLNYSYRLTNVGTYDDPEEQELGDSDDCTNLGLALWNETLPAFRPAYFPDDSSDQSYNAEADFQSFSFTLGQNEQNLANPDRKYQRLLVPLYYNSRGQIIRPYPVYNGFYKILLLTSASAAAATCVSSGPDPVFAQDYDMAYWFEPDAK